MPTTPELERFRAQSKLFGLLDEAGQRRLMAVAKTEQVPAGGVVVKQGDAGTAFFIVTEGALDVLVEDDGKQLAIARLEKGAFFGEIAALLGETRSATVKASGAVTLLRFEMPQVTGIIDAYPAVRQVLTKLALKRSEEILTQQMKHDFEA